jgi:hypothetical protein
MPTHIQDAKTKDDNMPKDINVSFIASITFIPSRDGPIDAHIISMTSIEDMQSTDIKNGEEAKSFFPEFQATLTHIGCADPENDREYIVGSISQNILLFRNYIHTYGTEFYSRCHVTGPVAVITVDAFDTSLLFLFRRV